MSKRTNIVVTGATGNVGGLVVDQLLARGARPTVFVRSAEKARARFGDRVDVVVGDLSDASSLSAALGPASVVFLVNSGPDLASRDAAAANVSRAAGDVHVVKLSTMDVEQQSVGTGVWHARGEAAIRDSGVRFTFVQPSGFMTNALAWAGTIRAGGTVRSSTGAGKIAFVHPEDIASVAVAALTSDAHVGASLPLSGPVALGYADMVGIIAARIGKPIAYESLTDDEQLARWTETGEPMSTYDYHLSIFRAIRAGKLSRVTDTVPRVLARDAITFDRWVTENASAFGG
jgi:uncharacterized protein YbjT (DUF2867 family)